MGCIRSGIGLGGGGGGPHAIVRWLPPQQVEVEEADPDAEAFEIARDTEEQVSGK